MTHYTGDKLPPYYIGSTSVKKVENGYHGTVKSKKFGAIWTNELKDNPHLFKTNILNRHSTREEAYLDEQKWQTKLNVVESDLFVNLKVQPLSFTVHGQTKTHSEETKAKMSISHKGIKPWNIGQTISEDHKAKISKAGKGKSHSEETKAKMSKSLKGKTHSEETKAKISASLKMKQQLKQLT
jgi:hypothetical protein